MEPIRNKKPTEDEFIPDKNDKYREDLAFLKKRVVSFVDQLMLFDVKFEEDIEEASIIAQRMIEKIINLCNQHLGRPNHKKPQKKQKIWKLKEISARGIKRAFSC